MVSDNQLLDNNVIAYFFLSDASDKNQYAIPQCQTVTILMQYFHKFFGKFITGPYWNAYPMSLKILDHKSEIPNSSLNYPKLRLQCRVGLSNLLLGRFGFCNPRLSSHGITSILLTLGPIHEIFTKKYWELAELENDLLF